MDARSAYRKELGQSAPPIRLVVLLYEQLVEDLRRAAAAIDGKDIEGRTHHLSHALAVIGQLDGSLNMQAGQEVARNLSDYYGVLRAGALQVQLHPDRRVLDKYISQLLSLREAWIEVERREHNQAAGSVQAQSQPVFDNNQHPRSSEDWRA